MQNSVVKLISPAAIIIAGFTMLFFIGSFVERNKPVISEEDADSDLTMNGSLLKGYLCGTEGLVADWYWIRSLQYVGDKLAKSTTDFINVEDLRNLNPRLLYPLLRNATDLDPGFIAAYNYGALVLPAIDMDKAIELTKSGIANNPNEWRLYQYLGYIYWRRGEYETAAATYATGAEIPGSAQFMKLMAVNMATRGGSRDTARAIFVQMLADAEPEDSQTIGNAKMRLAELDSIEEQDAIRAALGDYRKENGRCVSRLMEIVPALTAMKLPNDVNFHVDNAGNLVDPTGAPYLLDKETCDVKLDPAKTQLPPVSVWNTPSK